MLDAMLNAWVHGFVLTGAVALALRCAPRVNGATRHALWAVTLLLVVADIGASIVFGGAATSALVPVVHARVPLAFDDLPAIPVPALSASVVFGLLAVWACVAGVLLWRVAVSYRALQRLKQRTTPFPRTRLSAMRYLRQLSTTGRRARVRAAAELSGAVVLGGPRPVVAVGADLGAGLADAELDQVLVHEQSHLERRDDWAAIGQACIAAVCWCHPAVWIITRRLDFEREVACDDRVVAITGDARVYASALAHVRVLSAGLPAPGLAPAASRTSKEFLGRVDRLLRARGATRASVAWSVCVPGAAALALAFLTLHTLPAMFVSEPWDQTMAPGQIVATTEAQIDRGETISAVGPPSVPHLVSTPVTPKPRVTSAFGASAPRHEDAVAVSSSDVSSVGMSAVPPALMAATESDAAAVTAAETVSLIDPTLEQVSSAGATRPSALSGDVIDAHQSGYRAASHVVAQAGRSTAGFFKRVGLAIKKGVSDR